GHPPPTRDRLPACRYPRMCCRSCQRYFLKNPDGPACKAVGGCLSRMPSDWMAVAPLPLPTGYHASRGRRRDRGGGGQVCYAGCYAPLSTAGAPPDGSARRKPLPDQAVVPYPASSGLLCTFPCYAAERCMHNKGQHLFRPPLRFRAPAAQQAMFDVKLI